MKRSLTLAIAVFVISTTQFGCSSNSGKFYQHDGPPVIQPIFNSSSAKPRVENFYPASLRPYTVMGKRYVPITTDIAMEQIGTGSWYGRQFHGNKTAIGEIYDMHAMSAAHPTMPLPSYARVTNLENGKSVIVRVNDRGPFLNNRVIDLSYAAATALDYANKGTARVKVRRITNNEIINGTWRNPLLTDARTTQTQKEITSIQPLLSQPSFGWGIQVGFFSDRENAQQYAAHAEAILSSNGFNLPVRIIEDKGGYRIILGKELSDQNAREKVVILKDLLNVNAFIIQR